jgi:hypothetical protein
MMDKFIAGCAMNESYTVTMDLEQNGKLLIDVDNVAIGSDVFLSETDQRRLYEWLGKALGKE